MEVKAKRTRCSGCIHVVSSEYFGIKYDKTLPKKNRGGFPLNRKDSYCILHDKPVRAGASRICPDQDHAYFSTASGFTSIHMADIKDRHVFCEECNVVVDTKSYHMEHPHKWITNEERGTCSCGGEIEVRMSKGKFPSEYNKCLGRCGATW